MTGPITAPDLPDATRERLLGDLEPTATVSATMVLDQIARRDSAEREKRMVELTDEIRRLTIHVRNLTWAAVIVALGSLAVATWALITVLAH